MHTHTAAALAISLFSGSCASLSMQKTGFLDDYDRLESVPEQTVAFIPDEIWLYRDANSHSIDSLWIAPIEIRLAEDSEVELDDEDARDLKRAFENYLKRNLGEGYEIVDSPRESTGIVRTAITDVDPSSVLANIVGIILVVPFDMGGISAELEITSASTGSSIVAMKACRGGTPFLVIECFQRWGHAYHGMHKWTLQLRELLDEGQS